jgi:colanic acid biosynthesis glycosyl transferase WcaI
MIEVFRGKGVEDAKTVFFPNPVEFPEPDQTSSRGGFRETYGISPDAFLVSYSGNLGVKQGLGQIIEVATRLRDETSIQFVICGDGVMRRALGEMVGQRGLENVMVLPLQPLSLYHGLLVDSDFCLVTQQANSGAAFFPSKLLSIMAFARPVLAVADKESAVARLCREEGCGRLVVPDDVEAFATEILRGRNDRAGLEEIAKRGHAFVGRFRREAVIGRIEAELRSLTPDKSV